MKAINNKYLGSQAIIFNTFNEKLSKSMSII